MGSREEKQRDSKRARLALAVFAVAVVWLVLPGSASAAVQTYTETVGPIGAEGYEAEQNIIFAPHPNVTGFITHMDAQLVDANGDPVPVKRMMLHHLVFANASKDDETCNGFYDFGGHFGSFNAQRFYALGEEHSELIMPPGYGYPISPTDQWGVLYMIMNHKPDDGEAYIRYHITVDTDPGIQAVHPYWLDVKNCRADPIYNVPGTGGSNSTDTKSADFTIPEAGRIVSGGGHVHGGARELSLTEPGCGDREIASSHPTWGLPTHPYYKVRPILHEPGPIQMTEFKTAQGIPVAAGETLRLNSLYDNSEVHTRVMGIMIVFLAPDASVTQSCGGLPSDTTILGPSEQGRDGPIPFEVPINGFDKKKGVAVPIKAPPGELEHLRDGSTITAADLSFSKRNIAIHRGDSLNWQFSDGELHNLTVANAPVGFGGPNLDGGRTYSRKFRRPGTYRLFCALHPVAMTERVRVHGSGRH
jgi:plastocyanin